MMFGPPAPWVSCSAISIGNTITTFIYEDDISPQLMTPVWRIIFDGKRSWRWRTARMCPLAGRRHQILVTTNRRGTLSTLICLWWLLIGCRAVCAALVNWLFVYRWRLYLSWYGVPGCVCGGGGTIMSQCTWDCLVGKYQLSPPYLCGFCALIIHI